MLEITKTQLNLTENLPDSVSLEECLMTDEKSPWKT